MDILETLFWQDNFIIGLLLLELVLLRRFSFKKYGPVYYVVLSVIMLVLGRCVLDMWKWNGEVIVTPWSNVFWKAVLSFISVIQIMICFDASFYNGLYVMTLALVCQNIQFSVYAILEFVLRGRSLVGTPVVERSAILGISVLLLSLFFVYYVIAKRLRDLEFDVNENHINIILLGIGMFAINDCLNIYLFSNDPYSNFGKTMMMLRIYNIATDIIIVYMINTLLIRKNIEDEKRLVEAINRQRNIQYLMSRELIDNINIKSHDLKKQLKFLKSDEVQNKEYVEALDNMVSDYDSMIITDNNALTTVLTEKSIVCKSEGISFSCMIDDKAISFMNELDVYTLFANLMDNAIEASLKLSKEKRNIFVEIKNEKGFLHIHEENSFTGRIIEKDGIISTIKKDKMGHGFGIKSMRQMVEKYGGTLSYSAGQGVFKLNILIPIE